MIYSFKNRVKHLLGQKPILINGFFKIFGGKNSWLLFNNKTEIVIEGFPRSANTFSVVYFEITQPRVVSVAHHLHVEAQLIWAAQNSIPGVVLIREPEDCIRSLVVRESNMTVKLALKRYIKFYTNLLPYRDSLVVADFSSVIKNMGNVISNVNKKYGVSFVVCPHTEELEARVYKEIDSISSRLDGGKSTHVARPNNQRKVKNSQVSFDGCGDLLIEAERIYKVFVSG